MRLLSVIFTIAAALCTVASALSAETNGQRLARGLPPLPPARRSTRVSAARRSQPSGGINNSCNTGPVQCCNSITYASDDSAKVITSLLGLVLPADTAVGLTCHPLTAIGIGGNGCQSQPVCCENNDFEGAIVVGCSPININFG